MIMRFLYVVSEAAGNKQNIRYYAIISRMSPLSTERVGANFVSQGFIETKFLISNY